MARRLADVQVHAEDDDTNFEQEHLDVSVDLIDERLYLGDLACARNGEALKKLQITHVLTLDVVPLPQACLNRPGITFEYIKLCDVPKEDLISHLTFTNNFIKQAINSGGTILVHCVFGVSRSASVVISYIMEKYQLGYEDALSLVRSKRRYVGPNVGFVAQLKLFGHMGFRIDNEDPRYKQFRLRLAGQKFKQVKILPQQFTDLVKPDPGLCRERPNPLAYRCRRCRRVLAAQRNIIPHIPKPVKVELAKRGIIPPTVRIANPNTESGQKLIDKLQNLATKIIDTIHKADEIDVKTKLRLGKSHSSRSTDTLKLEENEDNKSDSVENSKGNVDDSKNKEITENVNLNGKNNEQSDKHNEESDKHNEESDKNVAQSSKNDYPNSKQIDESIENTESGGSSDNIQDEGYSNEYMDDVMVDASIAPRDCREVCDRMVFVEPMTWMRGVRQETQGRIYCPDCNNKLGNFSWIMGCKCPCGHKVAPAFYLIPSKVEWSNIVKNVQITV